MFRYKVSHFIQLQRIRDELRFRCFLEIHPGRQDAVLEWPYGKIFAFAVVHPTHRFVLLYKMHTSEHRDQACLQRPEEERNSRLGTHFVCTAEKLEIDGFVHDDMLHPTLWVEL